MEIVLTLGLSFSASWPVSPCASPALRKKPGFVGLEEAGAVAYYQVHTWVGMIPRPNVPQKEARPGLFCHFEEPPNGVMV